jgi:hypothetical protein
VTTGLAADAAVPAPPAERETFPVRFRPRPVPAAWPATIASREDVPGRLARPPFVLGTAGSQKQRAIGLRLLLGWLADQPGRSWQQRWLASGADAAGTRWRQIPAGWLRSEAEGLKVSLAGAEDKLAHIDRRSVNQPVDPGIPAPRQPHDRTHP